MELPADMTGLNLDKDPEQAVHVSDKLFLLSDLINDNTDSISHPPGTAEMRYDTKDTNLQDASSFTTVLPSHSHTYSLLT